MSDGGKGSGRRPGTVPEGNWEAIFGPKKPEVYRCPDDLHIYDIMGGVNSCLFCDATWPPTNNDQPPEEQS